MNIKRINSVSGEELAKHALQGQGAAGSTSDEMPPKLKKNKSVVANMPEEVK